MADQTNHGFRFLEGDDRPDIGIGTQQLAEDVDAFYDEILPASGTLNPGTPWVSSTGIHYSRVGRSLIITGRVTRPTDFNGGTSPIVQVPTEVSRLAAAAHSDDLAWQLVADQLRMFPISFDKDTATISVTRPTGSSAVSGSAALRFAFVIVLQAPTP